jgi:hypothetical protein
MDGSIFVSPSSLLLLLELITPTTNKAASQQFECGILEFTFTIRIAADLSERMEGK